MALPKLKFRGWTASDFPAIMKLQLACYPTHLLETEHTTRSRWEAYPPGFELAIVEVDGVEIRIAGLCQSFPWHTAVRGPPPLDDSSVVDDIRATAQSIPAEVGYYMHDIAVAVEDRKRGVGAVLMQRALARAAARGYPDTNCVAVCGMEKVWQKSGFAVQRVLVDFPCYNSDGKPAVLMVQRLAAVAAEAALR